jgi:hypothetical protein
MRRLMPNLIAISTYKKNQGLDELITTLLNNDYDKASTILITDDNDGEAKSVYEKYRKECKLVYITGPNGGIARNKNRAIKYFLSKPHFNRLSLLDDDLLFVKPGLFDDLEGCLDDIKLPVITGLWSDYTANPEQNILGASGNGWFDDFPPIGYSKNLRVSFHEGCHGCLKYLKREAVEAVGFFNVLPLGYGFEHSLYISRIMKQFNQCPRLFPIFRFSSYYYHGNKIPNNYEVDHEEVFKINGAEHDRILTDVFNGYSIYNKEHGLNKKKERCLD